MLILGGVVVILVIVVGVIFWWQRAATPELATTTQNTVTAANRLVIDGRSGEDIVTTANTPTLTESQQQQISVERLAMTFAERFGSYASTANFRNIREVQPMMTESMRQWSDGYIQTQIAKTADQNIVVSTRALATEAVTMSGTAATILVHTQRRTSQNGQPDQVINQDLRLDFVTAGQSWLVDGAYWQ